MIEKEFIQKIFDVCAKILSEKRQKHRDIFEELPNDVLAAQLVMKSMRILRKEDEIYAVEQVVDLINYCIMYLKKYIHSLQIFLEER